MINMYGRTFIGMLEGLPYGDCTEHFDDYKRDNCILERSTVISHFNSLERAYTSEPTYDLFSGERFLAGLYFDGNYTITADFIRYYNQGKVDIPEEYEDYLMNVAHIG